MFSFGCGANGQLGHSDTAWQPRPKRVAALAKERVVSVAACNNHSLALTTEGALFSFGHGANGQLGHGDTANQLRPKRVTALTMESVVAMEALMNVGVGGTSIAADAPGAPELCAFMRRALA